MYKLIHTQARTAEAGIQKALDIQARSATATFSAASELAYLLFDLKRAKELGSVEEKAAFLDSFSIENPTKMLQDALQLSGAASQEFEATRRRVIKPNFPDNMQKAIVEEPEDPGLLYTQKVDTEAAALVEKRTSKAPRSKVSGGATGGATKKPYAKKDFQRGHQKAGGAQQQMPQLDGLNSLLAMAAQLSGQNQFQFYGQNPGQNSGQKQHYPNQKRGGGNPRGRGGKKNF